METKTTQQIKVRACQIINTARPAWGAFGVLEEHGDYYDICGDAGHRVLSKSEANRFWKVL